MQNTQTKTTHNLKFKLLATLISTVLLYSCSSSLKSGANKNVASIYMPGLNLIDPVYKVFHKNDTLTEIHFRLNSTNILYTKKRGDTAFSANILIHYELTNQNTKALSDSASIYFTDYRESKRQKFLDGIIPIKTLPNYNYDLVVTVNDLTRDHYLEKKLIITLFGINFFF